MKLDIAGGGCFDPDVCEEDTRLTQVHILSTVGRQAPEVGEEDEEDDKPRKKSRGGRKGSRARRVDYSI